MYWEFGDDGLLDDYLLQRSDLDEDSISVGIVWTNLRILILKRHHKLPQFLIDFPELQILYSQVMDEFFDFYGNIHQYLPICDLLLLKLISHSLQLLKMVPKRAL